jgi:hypothetical protein
MDNWSDRRRTNPITLQAQQETVARMGILRADYHQGWSNAAHHQAGYIGILFELCSMLS